MRDLVLGGDIVTGQLIYVPRMHRYRHMYVLGRSGAGKSALLHRCILQDATRQYATVLFDAGDLANELIETLPDNVLNTEDERINRVDYFSVDLPIPYNPLARRRDDPGRLSSEIFSLLDQVTAEGSSTAPLSARMKKLLGFALNRIFKKYEEPTLADLATFLLEHKPEFQKLLDTDKVGFDLTHDAVLDRLHQFLRDPRVRRIVCQKNELDWDEIINKKRILLISLSGLDVPMIRFVGTVLFSGLLNTVLERSKHRRRAVACYIDEFHNYIASSLAVLTFQRLFKEGRKHQLALTVAHQDFGGIDYQLLDSIHGNVNNTIAFSCGPREAEAMSKMFGSEYSRELIGSLRDWHGVARVGNLDRGTGG